jgi:hypothetical protein
MTDYYVRFEGRNVAPIEVEAWRVTFEPPLDDQELVDLIGIFDAFPPSIGEA